MSLINYMLGKEIILKLLLILVIPSIISTPSLCGQEIEFRPVIISENFVSENISSQCYTSAEALQSYKLPVSQIFDSITFQPNVRAYLSVGQKIGNKTALVKVNNENSKSSDYVLELGSTYLASIDVYQYVNDRLHKKYSIGKTANFYDLPIQSLSPSIPFSLAPKTSTYFIFDFSENFDSEAIPVKLWEADQFQNHSNNGYVFYSGILIMMTLFSIGGFVLYFIFRSKVLLYYGFYASFTLLFSIANSNFGYQFFYPSSLLLSVSLLLASGTIASLFLLRLVLELYKEDIYSKVVLKLFPYIVGIVLVIQGIHFFRPFEHIDILNFHSADPPIGMLPLLLLMLMLSLLLRALYKYSSMESWLIFVAYITITICSLLFVLANQGLVQKMISKYIITSAFLFEMFLLASVVCLRLFQFYKDRALLDVEMKELQFEHEKRVKIQELDRVKTIFFTNITHEFRTPLTVIKGIGERLSGNEEDKKSIIRNSGILLNLVNQLLDISKANSGKYTLRPIRSDIVSYLGYLIQSYESWAALKNVRLHFLPESTNYILDFDPDAIQKILSNLLSNGIHHVHDGGDIYIFTRVEDESYHIRVKDSGIGISQEHLPYIFDHFYQVDGHQHAGSGIGLALCKELVLLMDGHISVQSELNIGSEFSFYFPIRNKEKWASEKEIFDNMQFDGGLSESLHENKLDIQHDNTLSIGDEDEMPNLLIVEDNTDVRNYIISCLSDQYHLLTARDGSEGIDKAIENIPDVIISDIMMPQVNGYELCEAIKSHILTSHIPVILLTAKVDRQAKLLGISKGADAYLPKPFDKDELRLRISSLIEQRKRIQIHYLSENSSSIPAKLNTENAFVIKVKKVIIEHLSDESFDVVRLSRALNLSRSQLYRKMKAITGKSLASYIRLIRLREGKNLLETTNGTVSEISYQVGFKDLSYFSTCFSEEFGYPPSATRK